MVLKPLFIFHVGVGASEKRVRTEQNRHWPLRVERASMALADCGVVEEAIKIKKLFAGDNATGQL